MITLWPPKTHFTRAYGPFQNTVFSSPHPPSDTSFSIYRKSRCIPFILLQCLLGLRGINILLMSAKYGILGGSGSWLPCKNVPLIGENMSRVPPIDYYVNLSRPIYKIKRCLPAFVRPCTDAVHLWCNYSSIHMIRCIIKLQAHKRTAGHLIQHYLKLKVTFTPEYR